MTRSVAGGLRQWPNKPVEFSQKYFQQFKPSSVCGGDGAEASVDVQAEESGWVCKARTGDQTAFAALVDRYWERLRRWLFHLTANVHTAEDITQEAFYRAWCGLPEFEDDGAFRVWLFRIAQHVVTDQHRGPRGVRPRPLSDVPSSESGPLEGLLEREANQNLRHAVAKLPAKYRSAYLLWTQEDLSYQQIAHILAITEATARWRVCKARQYLLNKLQAYLDTRKS